MTELTEERLTDIVARASKAMKLFAVYSVTGMHIGIWEDRETAEGVCDCDWFGDFIVELIDAELADDVPALVAEVRRLREALTDLRNWPPVGYPRRTDDGYPAEIAFDEFAYKRMVDNYRDAFDHILGAQS